MLLRLLTRLLLLPAFPALLGAQPIFLEAGGIVRVDVESAAPLGDWVLRDELPGFLGTAYLEYEGSNYFSLPDRSTLNYRIRITTPGTYQLRWHSRITEPGENTDYNDSWVRFPDADLVYGERPGSRVFPRGSGMAPVPEGSGSDNWLKAYQNRRDEWFWGVFTSDNDPHSIFAEFNRPGDYTVQIAGRSTGHAIDRFVLVHSSATLAEAQRRDAPESDRATTAAGYLTTLPLTLAPNPARTFLRLTLPTAAAGGRYRLRITDAGGRVVLDEVRPLVGGRAARVGVAHLAGGGYVLTAEAGGTVYTGCFLH